MQIMRKMDGHYSLRKETTIVTKHGERRLILWNITLVYDGRGEIVGLTCFGEDISEHREAEEVFKRYQLLSAHASDIILFFRREGRIIEANEASVKMYGYTREELLNMNITDLRAPESKSLLAEKIRQAEERGILYETMHQRRDGTIFPVEVSLQGTIYGNERVLFAIIRDITERKKAEETINHLAYHDPLTDLPNRILFYDRLTVAIANARRNRKMLAVMFLDLDRFKFINDMMGHAMGDQLLKDVARELRNHVRANDTVARLGGDEFTILLPDISREEDAAVVAQKINEALKRPWELNGYEFQITASIGIVLYPNDGTDADTLTKNADTAMYRAKEQGDNYQFYTPAMNVKALEMMEMEIALRRALEQGEFQVHYQPLVDIRAGKIIGMEALVRWRHPEKGLIMPADFIPVAEETGQIIPIGESVLRTACAQNKKWQEMGYPPMRIAVNLSACQFRQKNLVATIARVLEETGMEPGFLELEITESTAMQDVDFSISTLKTLREMGIRIAMDDFGTGYSSLSYLRRFPLTTLKVDRSFVRDVLSDVEDAAIVATIIVLAQNLKLKVVIEGVENEEQLAFFEQQECFEMQGYLFSGPLPANEIDQILIKYMSLQDRNLKVL
jgi:diguanylate cyclase (GGDEF)-like protein/PAS domain S-box-containing protein